VRGGFPGLGGGVTETAKADMAEGGIDPKSGTDETKPNQVFQRETVSVRWVVGATVQKGGKKFARRRRRDGIHLTWWLAFTENGNHVEYT